MRRLPRATGIPVSRPFTTKVRNTRPASSSGSCGAAAAIWLACDCGPRKLRSSRCAYSRTSSLKTSTRAASRPSTALTRPPCSSRRSAATTSRFGRPVRVTTSLGVAAPSTTAAKARSRTGSASSPARTSARICPTLARVHRSGPLVSAPWPGTPTISRSRTCWRTPLTRWRWPASARATCTSPRSRTSSRRRHRDPGLRGEPARRRLVLLLLAAALGADRPAAGHVGAHATHLAQPRLRRLLRLHARRRGGRGHHGRARAVAVGPRRARADRDRGGRHLHRPDRPARSVGWKRRGDQRQAARRRAGAAGSAGWRRRGAELAGRRRRCPRMVAWNVGLSAAGYPLRVVSTSWLFLATMIFAYGVANLLQSIAVARTDPHHAFSPTLLLRLGKHRVYLFGLLFQFTGFWLALLARRDLPLFLVQSAVAAGLGVTTLLGVLVLKWRLPGTEIALLGMLCLGLTGLVIAAKPAPSRQLGAAGVLGLAVALVVIGGSGFFAVRLHGSMGSVGLGSLAGLAFAAAAVAARPLASVHSVDAFVTHPLLYLLLAHSVVGQLLLGLAMQHGSTTAAVASMDASAAAPAAVLGLLLLGDEIYAGREWLAAIGFLATLIGVIGLSFYAEPQHHHQVAGRHRAAEPSHTGVPRAVGVAARRATIEPGAAKGRAQRTGAA